MLAADGALVLGPAVRGEHVRAERRHDGEDASAQTTSVNLAAGRVVRQLVRLGLDPPRVHLAAADGRRRAWLLYRRL